MKQENKNTANNGVVWYVFQNGKLIGHHGMYYFDSNDSAQGGDIWFIKSAQGKGFNKEIYNLLEKLAFKELKANRFARTCDANNINSKKCILSGGYHLDGQIRASNKHTDGTYSDRLIFTKLASEYKGK
jgi:RimJ/RimL family protein N-acetyltransferase